MASHFWLPLRAPGPKTYRSLKAVCMLVLLGSSLRCYAQDSDSPSNADKASRPAQSARLSVLNGGRAPHDGRVADANTPPPATNAPAAASPFDRQDLNAGHWAFRAKQSQDATAPGAPRLGHASKRARPIAGDFNGDGLSDVALYLDGEWFIDLDGDGQWSDEDLYVRLGGPDDQPVVGDWDGDGKDDVGVFGNDAAEHPQPAQSPDAEHANANQPASAAATDSTPRQARVVQRTRDGETRSNEVDHVLVFDLPGAVAVAGDFNGDGVDTLAIFSNGHWFVDVDGDGRFDKADFEADFGAAGDYPVVGDFTGDGVDEIGIFRNGIWRIDTNGNHQLDDEDLAFEFGVLGDLPVVADFTDSASDQAAVYHSSSSEPSEESTKE